MPRPRPASLPLVVAVGTVRRWSGARYALPPFGDAGRGDPSARRAALSERVDQGDEVPNVVTAVLASYRGYDTLGETTVIFTAGIGVLLLLRGRAAAQAGGAERGRRADEASTSSCASPPSCCCRSSCCSRSMCSSTATSGPAAASRPASSPPAADPLCPGVRPRRRASGRAAAPGRAHGARSGVLHLRRRRRRRPAARRELPRLFACSPTIRRTASELGIFLVEVGVLITVSGTMTAIFYIFAERGRSMNALHEPSSSTTTTSSPSS